MCLITEIHQTNLNNNNQHNIHLTNSFNPVTQINTMETGSHVAHLPNTCTTRLGGFGQQLEPLLPGKDNKRKRLNAVLDKLASNISRASDDSNAAIGVGDDPDSPDKSLEFEINVKTKFKKEESEDTSGDSDDNVDNNRSLHSSPNENVIQRLSSKDDSAEVLTQSPVKSPNKTFINSLFLKSPNCDTKQETNPLSAASQVPTLSSSYEEYMIKSHILSKMYLQQYCSNLTAAEGGDENGAKKKNGEQTKRKENAPMFDSPLDLSTTNVRQPDTDTKERLYPPSFPFTSLQQMLLQSNMKIDPHISQPKVVKLENSAKPQSPNTPPKPEPLTQSKSKTADSSSGKDLSYVCPICGQMFSLHDRLAKHMASRHKSKPVESSSKAYFCDVCKRSFARSDMLTRHMRLHTGIKPYTCRVCGQVFSRSDHLSTHQRTHTGEKPYKCPSCPYSACRRDMITRHMRTHSRYELPETSSIASPDIKDKKSNGHSRQFVKEELVDS